MGHKLVTCPQTAHLEAIEYESTPCGIVIESCTRFDPPSNVGCARDCARLLDRRASVDERGPELRAPNDDYELDDVDDFDPVTPEPLVMFTPESERDVEPDFEDDDPTEVFDW